MKTLMSILIVIGVIFTVFKLFSYWERVSQEKFEQEQAALRKQQVDPRYLEGVPRELEASLESAYAGGARGLKGWLEQNRRSPRVKDPRLAWIELDYVVKVSQEDPLEARKVFAAVKQRVPADSPVYPRIKQLEKTYE